MAFTGVNWVETLSASLGCGADVHRTLSVVVGRRSGRSRICEKRRRHEHVQARRRSRGTPPRASSLQRKLLSDAHASISVPSTEKCSRPGQPDGQLSRRATRRTRRRPILMRPDGARRGPVRRRAVRRRGGPDGGPRRDGTTSCAARARPAARECAGLDHDRRVAEAREEYGYVAFNEDEVSHDTWALQSDKQDRTVSGIPGQAGRRPSCRECASRSPRALRSIHCSSPRHRRGPPGGRPSRDPR